MKNKDEIIIQCWTGKTLFEGDLNSNEVEKVLELNKCSEIENHDDVLVCHKCNDTNYEGDFEVYFKYPELNEGINVYECINY